MGHGISTAIQLARNIKCFESNIFGSIQDQNPYLIIRYSNLWMDFLSKIVNPFFEPIAK